MSDDFICYAYPYMYYMVYGDNDGECLLKEEHPDRTGGYFIPLNKDRLYPNYLVEFVKNNELYASVAHCNEQQQCFEIAFDKIKTTFGLVSSKIYKYAGAYINPEFQYGLVEVGIKLIEELFKEDNILVIGCDANCHCKKRVERIDVHAKTILLTGGIGDIFAIDSLLSDEVKENIETICYASKQAPILQKLLKAVPEYRNAKHVVVWDEWKDDVHHFMYKKDCPSTDEHFLESTDFGIFALFPQFANGYLEYRKSSWLSYTLCEIKVSLPEEFALIFPRTNSNFRNVDGTLYEVITRNFSENDWKETLTFLEKRNIKGVVLNEMANDIPDHPNLINYTGQTNILESIEIVKKCAYYIGIDSCLSVFATKLLPVDHLAIKLVLMHGITWKRAYWAPHTEFPFLKNIIKTDHLT